MGRGISLICECGKKENITLGVGMLYPDVLEDTLEEIRNGVYGDEWKDLYISKEDVEVDVKKYLFYCKVCGHWEIALGLDMYEPNHPEGERLLKEYAHRCPKCEAVMEKTDNIDDGIFKNLSCKMCGKKMRRKGFLMWD